MALNSTENNALRFVLNHVVATGDLQAAREASDHLDALTQAQLADVADAKRDSMGYSIQPEAVDEKMDEE